MKKFSCSMIAATVAATGLAGSAFAQISSITQPFVGEYSELWQTAGSGFPHCVENGVFSGQAALCTFNIDTGAPTSAAHVTGGWGFNCSIGPFVPNRLFGIGSGGGAATFDFLSPVGRFGGYFGTNSNDALANGGGTIKFYDVNNTLVEQLPILLTVCGQWEWYGWESSVPILRIQVHSNRANGAHIMMDALEMDLFTGGPGCYANCDNSTTPPVLNVDDFTCFINEFAAASQLPHEQQINHYANCDNSTTAPALNVDDFTCFINEFAQGCP